MLRVQDSKAKEEQIMNEIANISSWWHKWEEDRNGKRIVCIEYQRLLDPMRDGVTVEGDVT